MKGARRVEERRGMRKNVWRDRTRRIKGRRLFKSFDLKIKLNSSNEKKIIINLNQFTNKKISRKILNSTKT